jgi:hypothetical protein
VSRGKTHAEVKAELAQALRTGDIVADGDTGKKLNKLIPNRYPANWSPAPLCGFPLGTTPAVRQGRFRGVLKGLPLASGTTSSHRRDP